MQCFKNEPESLVLEINSKGLEVVINLTTDGRLQEMVVGGQLSWKKTWSL